MGHHPVHASKTKSNEIEKLVAFFSSVLHTYIHTTCKMHIHQVRKIGIK